MAADFSSNVRIVLVEPSHPGNIGAVARAMKNMALVRLALVRPRNFPHPEATARASGADDVLAAAHVVDTLQEAIADCGFIAATTARERDQNFRVLDVRPAAERVVLEAARAPVAVLFGAERTGLRNEHLEFSHVLLRIPANPAYASLNLAMAVQLVSYEIYRAAGAGIAGGAGVAAAAAAGVGTGVAAGAGARAGAETPRTATALPPATPVEMQRLYAHLEQVMTEADFRDRTQSGNHLMSRIRRFLQRAELDQNEVNILRGILTAVQNRRRSASHLHPPSQEPPA